MAKVAESLVPEADIMVFAAAVADFTPVNPSDHKIKRTGDALNITLSPTRDIAAWAGKNRKPGQILAGFALETDNAEENAYKKLISKNLDLIILNRAGERGAGFGVDTNKISIIGKDNKRMDFELKSKDQVALDITDTVFKLMNYVS
jgi:phosphopantothenoylcysteine decarboxylase/phosphopantothenate--cysteine ligase